MYGRNSCMASPLIGYETYSPQQDNSSIKLSPSSSPTEMESFEEGKKEEVGGEAIFLGLLFCCHDAK